MAAGLLELQKIIAEARLIGVGFGVGFSETAVFSLEGADLPLNYTRIWQLVDFYELSR
ncbi:hypothetical protein [Variovorax sp. CCNWLW235]|uniref:hypothetical protein n=1 Tax=Variovorax sp. CCNWLW235 TaxID=3127463 RepID=UPI00307718F9